jgi:DNA polymerase-4
MTERAIIHVDMDAFYAAVEVLDDARLDGLPVIVGGTPAGRGVVAAASYEARAFGVQSAMSAARAHRLCPTGVFRPPRPTRYRAISRRVFALLAEYTPLVEPLSIDEAFLDVSGSRRLYGPPVAIATELKRRIRTEIGLTASFGVAPNKFLAKLASELEKPDGLVVIGAEEAASRLAPLPVWRIWGVGPAANRALARLGVRTVADLRAVPLERLRGVFGERADRLLRLAWGEDDRPVVPQQAPKSVGHETTFVADIADEGRLIGVLDELVEAVARRLRRWGGTARTVTVKARYPDFTTVTRSRSLAEPTAVSVVIRTAARELFRERLGRRGRPLRLLGVSVSNLALQPGGPGDLFEADDRQRQSRLDALLDQAHGRYPGLLRRGAAHGTMHPPGAEPPFAKHDTD